MTIPFPYNATAGVPNDPAEPDAANLQAQLMWIARWANELVTDVQLDLKKVAQFVGHMRKYRALFAKLQTRISNEGTTQDADWPFQRPSGQIGALVRGFMQFRKMTWATQAAMLSDLNQLNTDCGAFADWIEANQGEYKNGYTTATVIGTDTDGAPVISDTPVVIAKPAAFTTRITAFRANFG